MSVALRLKSPSVADLDGMPCAKNLYTCTNPTVVPVFCFLFFFSEKKQKKTDRTNVHLGNVCFNGSGYINPDHLLLQTNEVKLRAKTVSAGLAPTTTREEGQGQLVVLRCMEV